MKKIAFLFLTRQNHKCPQLWETFFNSAPRQQYRIYCHYKSKPTQSFLKNNTIPYCIPTQWADISLVKATLLLLKNALQDIDNAFFILLSESCIPIISFQELYQQVLKNNISQIAYQYLPNKRGRYLKLHPELRDIILPHKFYCAHQWILLQRNLVQILLKKDITHYYLYMPVADEHYFINMIILLGLEKNVKNQKMTYCDWSRGKDHPTTLTQITKNQLLHCRQQGYYFIRKVSSNTSIHQDIFDMIR